MLKVESLNKEYTYKDNKGKKKILHAVENVSFKLENETFCAIVGESGSGKTTLSHLMTCLAAPTSGDIEIDGVVINKLGRDERRDIYSKIQLVLQDSKSALDPCMTIYNSIAEPLRNIKRLPKDEEREKIYSLAEIMELSIDDLKKKPDELSGGQLKRVCIARALIVEPQVIIFDEAITGLDVIVRKKILDLIKDFHKKTKGIYIFITHDIDVAFYLASRILIMKDGKIVEDVEYKGDNNIFEHKYSKMLIASM